VRLYRNGQPDPGIEAIILANVRTPAERLGDMRAQVAANRRGVQRLVGLAEKYGTAELLRIMQAVLDYSEVMMRQALAGVPDGESRFEDVIDGDGVSGRTFTIKLKLTKRGEHITADFEGSDGAVPGPMNAPLSVTASGVYAALKMIVDPDSLIPPNSGCWRAVTVTAPKGSVVNAQEPSPVVYSNHEMSHRVSEMVFAAMYRLTPGRVLAGSQGTSGIATFGGVDYRSGERFVSYESVKGGFGARPVKDGINAVSGVISNMLNTPIEVLEMSFPLRVEEYALVQDSGGAGTWRGGLGVRRAWRILGHEVRGALCFERCVTPPFGQNGGGVGSNAKLWMELPDGTTRMLPGKGAYTAPAGAKVVVEAPGSGGFGPPSARDPAMLESDLLDGYVSEHAARELYGRG
jgi:N-methylhydantoinase B